MRLGNLGRHRRVAKIEAESPLQAGHRLLPAPLATQYVALGLLDLVAVG